MTDKPTARRHHFVPQGYLAAFTDSGTKTGQCFVQDIVSGRWFKTTPQNVAVKKDFNRIESDTHPPDAIESALGDFEGQAVEAIRRVLTNKTYPSPQDLNLILNLVALLASRNPKMRESFNTARSALVERVSDLLVSSPAMWENHVRKARAAGENIPESVTYEQARDFVRRGEYTLTFSPGSNLRVELAALDKLLPVLGKRIWTLMLSPDSGPEFICSDHPVTLFWKEPRGGPVGYGLEQTEVFFPLGPGVGLYGTFEDPLPKVISLDEEGVAVMNSRVAAFGQNHIFSRRAEFMVKRNGRPTRIQVEPRSEA